MRLNRIFVLAVAFAAMLYLAPTKDHSEGPKSTAPSTNATSSTCPTKDSIEAGALKLGVVRTSEGHTTESIE
jgi:hypothetical protein